MTFISTACRAKTTEKNNFSKKKKVLQQLNICIRMYQALKDHCDIYNTDKLGQFKLQRKT